MTSFWQLLCPGMQEQWPPSSVSRLVAITMTHMCVIVILAVWGLGDYVPLGYFLIFIVGAIRTRTTPTRSRSTSIASSTEGATATGPTSAVVRGLDGRAATNKARHRPPPESGLDLSTEVRA